MKTIMKETIVKLLVIVFLIVGIVARVWKFGIVPGDINQDEAFAAYEAYSLLNYGIDSHGYRFPVYLVAWGSGMNALNTYLMMPFIAVFGLKTWVIRLPQLICACLTLYAVYLIIKKVYNEKIALCALFLLTISPWHIFLSRWGLESNLAPAFLIFGLYFFMRGIEQPKCFLISALMYGLSLYCYATIWPVVPIILLLQFLYCLYYKKIIFSKEIIFAVMILSFLALPLLIFLLINAGVMEEILLPFVSIPRLLYMRANEISLKNIVDNYVNLRTIILQQSDSLIWNSTDKYGIFYYCSLPFVFLGGGIILVRVIKRFKNKEFNLEVFIFIQFIAGMLLGLLIHVNITRVNIIFIPLIMFAAVGVWEVCERVSMRLLFVFLFMYMVLFCRFEKYYFTDYAEEISVNFSEGLESAMEEAMSYENDICVSGVNWAKVLYYSKIPVAEYIESVKYTNFPSAFLSAESFGRFTFTFDASDLDLNKTYILGSGVDYDIFINAGFTIHSHGHFVVAIPNS